MADPESLQEYDEIVRKMFASEEEGFQFYNPYGLDKGFSVRRSYVEWTLATMSGPFGSLFAFP